MSSASKGECTTWLARSKGGWQGFVPALLTCVRSATSPPQRFSPVLPFTKLALRFWNSMVKKEGGYAVPSRFGHYLIAHYATLDRTLGKYAKRLVVRWDGLNTLGDPRDFPSGATGSRPAVKPRITTGWPLLLVRVHAWDCRFTWKQPYLRICFDCSCVFGWVVES